MPNRLNSTPQKGWSKRTGCIKKVQAASASTVIETLSNPGTIEWITSTEEFLGLKIIEHIQTLEWKKREEYLSSVKESASIKPIISQLITRFQISERVSISRVMAYIQAGISQG